VVRRVLGILVAVLMSAGAFAACSAATPFSRSQAPVQECQSPDERPSPGDVVCFSGELDEPLEISVGGTQDAPVVYRGGGTVVPGIRVEADHVVVDGFVSRGADSTGIWVSGENITVQNNEITQVEYTGDDVDGIRFFGDGTKLLFNRVYDLEASDDIGDAHVDCMQTFATSGPGSSNVVIQGNRCEGIRAQCLMAEGPNDEGGSGEGESRNWLFDGNYCDSHAEAQSVALEDIQDVTITNNDMVGTGNKAFALGEGSTGATIRGNRIGPGYGREVEFDDPSASVGYQGPPAD
jgi:Right handed beta helix region